MAKDKQTQIPLVATDGTTQPPFPAGWVLAIFDALHTFAPEHAAQHCLPISRRTQVRIKSGESIKQSTYDEIRNKLVDLITALFPVVSTTKGFAAEYVDEYFNLWKSAAEIAPHWAKAFGFEPECSAVLARALLRDLVLRLCYLESCERLLSNEPFDDGEFAFLRHSSPKQVYTELIRSKKYRDHLTMEKLAESLELSDDSALRRIKRGEEQPKLLLLRNLVPTDVPVRLLAAVGFLDDIAHQVGFGKNGMLKDCLKGAERVLTYHPISLPHEKLAAFIAEGRSLLLHPGFESVWQELPDALWRAHLHTLVFARMPDLAQAYLQFSAPDDDQELIDFLLSCEQQSGGSSFHWQEKLREPNNVVPFPKPWESPIN